MAVWCVLCAHDENLATPLMCCVHQLRHLHRNILCAIIGESNVCMTMRDFSVYQWCLLSSLLAVCGGQEQNLTFLLITSFGQFGFNSSGLMPAADMALEDINSNQQVLPGYRLMYDRLRDSQVSLGLLTVASGVASFFCNVKPRIGLCRELEAKF